LSENFRNPSPNPAMDVEKCAPFTSSPLDSSRGRGRRLMLPRMRQFKPVVETAAVIVHVQPTIAPTTEQTTVPQVGGSSNGKK
jgi:hypothetical protein